MALNFANNNSLSAITAKPSGLSGGALNLISTQTASSSSTISFTSGIDSTYDVYMFKFYDIHTSSAGDLTFQADTGTNTNYNQTITSTFFEGYHYEDDSDANLGYRTSGDQAQGTSFQKISSTLGTNNDDSAVGTLTVFNPSSTTFVKHYILRSIQNSAVNYPYDSYSGGYGNTTSAIDAVQFKSLSGNIDSGTFKLYGIKDS